jgi:hypothetical protein
MKRKYYIIIILILVASNLKAQDYAKVMPGNIRYAADSITLYPFYNKTVHGVQVLHVDRILNGDSLIETFYLKKVSVQQESGKIYLNSNKVATLIFYRYSLRSWSINVPSGADLINFNKYLNNQ